MNESRVPVDAALAIVDRSDEAPPLLVQGSAVGVNTVRIDGVSSATEMPYIVPVDSGDRVLLARIDTGAYVILGPINQP